MLVILGQMDFKEQIEKEVKLLFCITKNFGRKDHVWVHFVPSQ
jgi:hypothetical protein